MRTIELKSFAGIEFEALWLDAKKSDARLNDKKYRMGDILVFKEGFPSLEGYCYTGRSVTRRVTHVSTFGMQHNFVNLSLEKV